MARPRTILSDYNPMRLGFGYVFEFEDGTSKHGRIYAHNCTDAAGRLCEMFGKEYRKLAVWDEANKLTK